MPAVYGTKSLHKSVLSTSPFLKKELVAVKQDFKQVIGAAQNNAEPADAALVNLKKTPETRSAESFTEELEEKNPEIIEMTEELKAKGELPTMQELAFLLQTDADTLTHSLKTLALLFKDNVFGQELPDHLKAALESFLADGDQNQLLETLPIAELAGITQLIASHASQIVKETDKQAAMTALKAAQLINQFAGQKQDDWQVKALQASLQNAEELLGKGKEPSPSGVKLLFLQAAFENYAAGEVKPETGTAKQPAGGIEAFHPFVMQMSKAEQFAISVKTDARPMNMEQFIEKFTHVLNNSNLLKTPNGTKLLIKLYPEQLGSLRIELLQQNGVMTAKILSSTQAVKELLEQNAHQLKQAFGQQNVSVDKIEVVSPDLKQHLFDRGARQQQKEQQKEQPNHSTEDEAPSFADLLTDTETGV